MDNITNVIGYAAMVVVVLSFLPGNIKWVRMINLAGCILFIIYGFKLGHNWPIIISNAAVAAVQCYALWIKKKRLDFFVSK